MVCKDPVSGNNSKMPLFIPTSKSQLRNQAKTYILIENNLKSRLKQQLNKNRKLKMIQNPKADPLCGQSMIAKNNLPMLRSKGNFQD